MKSSEYFDYTVPPLWELAEDYQPPYRFSEAFVDKLDKVFLSPRHKWSRLYSEKRYLLDRHEMAGILYIYIMYANDNLPSIGGAIDNLIPHMTVSMWKKFLGNQKHYKRTMSFEQYYPAKVSQLHRGVTTLVDDMQRIILTKDYIFHGDDMVKERQGKTLRESDRGGMREGGAEFEYLCSVCDNETIESKYRYEH